MLLLLTRITNNQSHESADRRREKEQNIDNPQHPMWKSESDTDKKPFQEQQDRRVAKLGR